MHMQSVLMNSDNEVIMKFCGCDENSVQFHNGWWHVYGVVGKKYIGSAGVFLCGGCVEACCLCGFYAGFFQQSRHADWGLVNLGL